MVTVPDTGAGIEPEDLPNVFERFYRGQQTAQSNIPGTGLGLAIAKELVELHGGRVEVESVQGKGATFRVWLPLAEFDRGFRMVHDGTESIKVQLRP